MQWYQKFLFLLLLSHEALGQNLGGFCQTPTGESGKCISIYKCTTLINLLRSPSRTEAQTTFIRSSQCGTDSSSVVYVCCGSSPFNEPQVQSEDYEPNSAIPSRHECGWQSTERILGGEQTSLDEFPWMALIQYFRNGKRTIACAGSLINSRYILTAAHCVGKKVQDTYGRVHTVRLGEYDTNSPTQDCFEPFPGSRTCNQPEINAGVEEIIPHPEYSANTQQNDIALIRLDRDIPFSDYIQPICLPLPTEASEVNEKLVVAGWGRTEYGRNSTVKLKVQVPVVSKESCASVFKSLGATIGEKQLCAGGEERKDSCTGDSGGPLMRKTFTDKKRWMAEGVVSFGYHCGLQGYPGVYTKVASFIPWIHKNVKP